MGLLRVEVAGCVDARRRALGISVSTLAGEVGCSRATINQVRAAKVGVGLRTLAAIAMVFACGADDLVEIESLAHVAPPPTSSIDIVRVLARNVTAMWPLRFENVEALARAAGISTSQLYVILDAGCDPSIDRVGQLAHALSCAPRELLRSHAQHFPEFWTRRRSG